MASRIDRLEFEQDLGVGDEQGSLVCCTPWGHKELDTGEGLNCSELQYASLEDSTDRGAWGLFFMAVSPVR